MLQALLDYDQFSGVFTWKVRVAHRCKIGGIAGHMASHGRRKIAINQIQYYAYRIAWKWMTGEEPEGVIDHINGDYDDNRWANLRHTQALQNTWNMKIAKNNKTGYKGVSISKNTTNGFCARIKDNGKYKVLGYFKTPEEAHDAYQKRADELRGEFCPSLVRSVKKSIKTI